MPSRFIPTACRHSCRPTGLQQAQAPLRFLQEARLRGAWLAPFGGNSSKLGVTVAEVSATFAIPVMYNQAPILITPGAAGNWWNGPVSQAPDYADLPPATYDTYIDAGWQPQITPWLSANVGVRTGLVHRFPLPSIRTASVSWGVGWA